MTKNACLRLLLYVFLFLCINTALSAQDSATQLKNPALFSGTKGFRKWSIGFTAGALSPSLGIGGRNDFPDLRYSVGYGIFLKYQITHAFGMRAEYLQGSIEGASNTPITSTPPPYVFNSFKTLLNRSAALSGVITFNNISWTRKQTFLQPYIRVGAGMMNITPILTTANGMSYFYKADSSAFNRFFVPAGIGFKLNITQGVNIDIGYSMQFVDSDDMDGYISNPINNDKFSYAYLGLHFSFGKKSKPQLSRHNPAAQLMDLFQKQLTASKNDTNHMVSKQSSLQDSLMHAKMQEDLRLLMADADKDGISDYFDKCPNTPSGQKTDGAGCPLERSGDVITNINYYQPTAEDKKVLKDAFENLEFDFGKATIRTSSYESLNRIAAHMKKNNLGLIISGHTDNIGKDWANMDLSRERAQAVKVYLILHDADPMKIETRAYGASMPIYSNQTAAGRSRNRRVEFSFYQPEGKQ